MSPYPLPPTLSNSDLYLAPRTTKINPTMIDARCSMPQLVFVAYSNSPHSWQQITVPSILLSNHRQSPPIALTLGWSNPLPSISNQQSERSPPTTTNNNSNNWLHLLQSHSSPEFMQQQQLQQHGDNGKWKLTYLFTQIVMHHFWIIILIRYAEDSRWLHPTPRDLYQPNRPTQL
jgi:hypothetical protein